MHFENETFRKTCFADLAGFKNRAGDLCVATREFGYDVDTYPRCIYTATGVIVFDFEFDMPQYVPTDLDPTFSFFEELNEVTKLDELAGKVSLMPLENARTLAQTITEFAHRKSMYLLSWRARCGGVCDYDLASVAVVCWLCRGCFFACMTFCPLQPE